MMQFSVVAALLVALSNPNHAAVAFSPTLVQPAQNGQQGCRFQPVAVSVSEINDTVDDEVDDVDSTGPEDYIVNAGDLEDSDEEDGIEDDGEPPVWYTSQQRMDELRAKHRRHDKDTGSPEFQVASMTERISYLTKHLKVHPKDFSTRRGLVALVNKRRRLLNYLFREEVDRYSALVNSLGVRHKAPSKVTDRNEQYGRFPPQKVVKKHLKK